MRLTRQSEIAIAILAACARRPGAHVHTSIAAIEAGASRMHTAKVVHVLVHAGFLATARGRAGGIALAVPASSIKLSAVLRHTQPDLVETDVPARRKPVAHAALDIIIHAARGTFLTLMGRFTVADLVTEPAVNGLACFDCGLMRATCPAMAAASLNACHERAEPHVAHTHS